MLPTKARIEACTLCQLNCKSCSMRLGNYCKRGAGYLKYDDFAAFIRLNPYIKEIELSNNGEIFLNPELGKIIEHAFNNGVRLYANNGVNFNNVSPKILSEMVKFQFEKLVISIDGWNQETYVQYRQNGNFDNVISNIKLLNKFKIEASNAKPLLDWKYIIFEHNDDADGAKVAQNLAKELGMNFYFSKDWDGYEPKNIKSLDSKKCIFSGWPMPCQQLWNEPQINWDGHFLGCCANNFATHALGDENLFEVPLAEYLELQIVKDTKLALMGKKSICGINTDCETCPHYQYMKSNNSFISEQELQNGGRIIGV